MPAELVTSILGPVGEPIAVASALAALLRAAHDHADAPAWPRMASEHATHIDMFREAFAGDATTLVSADAPSLDLTAAIHRHLPHLAGCPDLVVIATAARAIDDCYGDLLDSWWNRHVTALGLSRGDLIPAPNNRHALADLLPGWSLSAPVTRAADIPYMTARAQLYLPGASVPSVRVSDQLDGQLAAVLQPGAGFASCHPNRHIDEFILEAPVRLADPSAHRGRCRTLVEAAIAHGATIIVLPEFTGTADVVDDLRRISSPRPCLIVAGSGHVRNGDELCNRAHFWVVTPEGVTPAAQPLTSLKRAPSQGKLGKEPLTRTGDAITIYCDLGWRLAVLICRDALDPDVRSALV